MDELETYRAEIDALDGRIIGLLRARYDVIEKVAALKAREGIPATIPERVDVVCENAAGRAAECGLDQDFIRDLYSRLIEHSCTLEEKIISSSRQKKVQG